MTLLEGATTALLTPCTDTGSLDVGALDSLIEVQVEKGVVGLFVLGTAGQGPMLSVEERKSTLERIVSRVDGRIQVVAHVGAMPTSVAVDLALHAHATGVDAISSVPPVYYRPDFPAVREYYETIAGAVPGLPLLAYNNPPATGYELTSAQASTLHKDGVIYGLKQASASVSEMSALVALGVPTWMANADLNLAALAMGAVGTISTITNVTPEPFVALYKAVTAGDLSSARSLQQTVDFCAARLRQPTIGALHAGATLRGWSGGFPRKPLRMPTPEESRRIAEAVELVRTGAND